jgi:hypothetical protein
MEAILIFIGILVLVHWFDYQRSIQEYSVTQVPIDELAGVMTEKTPVMVELGLLPWRPEIAQTASWGADLETKPIENETLAAQMELANGLADIDSARCLWWLPGVFHPSVDIINNEVEGLTWVTAERQWIGCTSGAPLTVWLVHSRYRRYLPERVADPWSLTVAEAPYIGRVQYIEVLVKPGWSLGLPSHWGYAVKSEGSSWSWTAEQHSLCSLAVTKTPAVLMNIKSIHLEHNYTLEHEGSDQSE